MFGLNKEKCRTYHFICRFFIFIKILNGQKNQSQSNYRVNRKLVLTYIPWFSFKYDGTKL